MADPLRIYAQDAAFRAGIDGTTFERQIDQESGFNPLAYNAGSDASGIAQIVPRWHPGVDVWNPRVSLDYAAQLMAGYIRAFGDYRHALAAYNWGSGHVGGYTDADGVRHEPWNGQRDTLPGETARYLDVILGAGWPEPGAPTMPTTPPPYTYNRNEPPHPQDETYDCSQDSLEWALYSLARGPSDGWLEETMIREGVMSPDLGLLDASGAGLAAFVVRHYGSGPEPENTLKANNEPSISWEWAVHEGAANGDGSGHGYPVLIGGRKWGHWSGLRDYDPVRGVLLLANPAENWMGVKQTMTRDQFEALGPFSAVRIWHPDLLGSEPTPPTPPPPAPDPLAAVRARLRAVSVELESIAAALP